jgi:hypothetical protein
MRRRLRGTCWLSLTIAFWAMGADACGRQGFVAEEARLGCDCASGFSCIGGRCVGDQGSSCIDNTDCVEVCIDTLCAPLSAGGGPCDQAEDCTSGHDCSATDLCRGTVGTICTTNVECLEACINDACAPLSLTNGPCDEDADCSGGATCPSGTCSNRVDPLLVEPVYPSFANWNAYVRHSVPAQDVFHQPEVACDGSETGPGGCFHAGELRKIVVAGLDTCAGLSLTDALGAFDWQCQDDGVTVTFYSSGLAAGRGLGDLITPAGWLANSVTLRSGAGTVAISSTAVWDWANAVVGLPDNSASAALSITAANTIHVADASRASNGYNIAADGIAVVALPGVVLTYAGSNTSNCNSLTGTMGSPDIKCQLAAGGKKFLWLEGELDGEAGSRRADRNVLLASVSFSRLHRLTSRRSAGSGVELRAGSRNNDLRQVTVIGAGGSGIDLPMGAANDDNRFDNILIQAAELSGMYVRGGDGNRFLDVTIDGGGDGSANHAGFFLDSSNNRVYGVRVTNFSSHALRVQKFGNVIVGAALFNNDYAALREWSLTGIETGNNTFVDVTAVGSGGDGILVQKATRSTYAHVTTLNSPTTGLSIGLAGSSSTFHTFASVLAANIDEVALLGEDTPGSDNHLFIDMVAAHGRMKNIRLGNAGHRFTGELWVSAATLNCDVGGLTTRGLVHNTCTTSGAEGSADYTGITPASDATLHISADLTDTFVGKVSTDDARNTADVAGSASFGAIADWTRFENRYRGWAPDGAAFPSTTNCGRCTSGTCRIWDARLRATDTRLRNTSGAFVAAAACPASVTGFSQKIVSDQQPTPNSFLVHAIEMILDGAGDDDGLCESNETCIYAPNVGAYQGEGTLAPCSFNDGAITNVTMFGYTTNGG